MNFYKTVVKAISGAMACRDEEQDLILGDAKKSNYNVEEELNRLNKAYIDRINEMLGEAAYIIAMADKDWRYD